MRRATRRLRSRRVYRHIYASAYATETKNSPNSHPTFLTRERRLDYKARGSTLLLLSPRPLRAFPRRPEFVDSGFQIEIGNGHLERAPLKFFIDTASVSEIREAAEMGLLDGVTTNPSLLSKETGSPTEILREITKIVEGPVSAEVTALDHAGMIAEATELGKIADNIVIKIPMTLEGLKALKTLSSQGIKTNCTLIFSAPQALMAAKAGASFASPFVGRLDDLATDGMELIRQICTIYENYGFATEVLVASVRHPIHVVEAAMLGAHVVTMPSKVIAQLVKHPLTDRGLEQFLADWEKVKDRT